MKYTDDRSRWQAVVRRDSEADGAFVFSVRTTGVFCRPSCPARRPNRENVRFHASNEEARRAGFRSCKRCRPEDPHGAVTRACRLIEKSERVPSLSQLAAAAGLSLHHFHRLFKRTTGVTPREYAMKHTEKTVKGISIQFAVGESSLGLVLVAATDKGVCAVFLGDDPDELARELQDRFPHAAIAPGDAKFDRWVSRVVGMVERPGLSVNLPLDIRGTAFQVRVWNALRKIPAGSTTTYAEIAKRIGRPTASRAVAGACAANHIAIAIPCHRVIRTDESLSGYRWGVERKAELLKREKANGAT